MADDLREGLKFFIQYRGKRNPGAWHTMAAFDVVGPAEWYLNLQNEESGARPWEYRLVALPDTSHVRGEKS